METELAQSAVETGLAQSAVETVRKRCYGYRISLETTR